MDTKGLLTWMGMNSLAVVSLIVCLTAFCAIVVWAFTRPRAEMESRARMCLDENDVERNHG